MPLVAVAHLTAFWYSSPASRQPLARSGCYGLCDALRTVETPVDQHKFKVGQSVSFVSGPFGRGGANGIFKITQLLPPEGDDYQYRIKSASEPHERVVKESQLDRIG